MVWPKEGACTGGLKGMNEEADLRQANGSCESKHQVARRQTVAMLCDIQTSPLPVPPACPLSEPSTPGMDEGGGKQKPSH